MPTYVSLAKPALSEYDLQLALTIDEQIAAALLTERSKARAMTLRAWFNAAVNHTNNFSYRQITARGEFARIATRTAFRDN